VTRAATGQVEDSWRARPVLSAIIRLIAFVVPLALSTGFAVAASVSLPAPSSRAAQIAGWIITAFASTGVLMLADHAARRLLPLAALMNLSIVFPDQAPSRYQIARRAAGVRNLQARLERARRLGEEDEPVRAAALILELVTALQRHDRRTRGHSERVHLFTEMLARELDLPEEDRDKLRWAALVHDVGKLAVPEQVLNKPGRPDEEEWEKLRQHPVEGARLCAALRPWMGEWWLAIEQHHEHYDGAGYPRGLAGKDISLGARIISVADSFEVMTAARSYKHAGSAAAGREELARYAGTQFDPDIVRAFLTISLGRMRLALGPLAWFAQFPMVEGVIRAGGLVRLVGGMVATASTAVIVGAPTLATEAPASSSAAAAPAREAAATDVPSDRSPLFAVPPYTPASDVAGAPTETGMSSGIETLDTTATLPTAPAPAAPPGPVQPGGGAAPPPAAPPAPSAPIDATPPADPPSPPPGAPTPAPSPAPTSAPSPTPTPAPGPSPTPTPTPAPAPPPALSAPTAVTDAATTEEDSPVVVDVLANDTDIDGDTLAVTTATDGARGTTTVTGNTVTYDPDPDTNGVDTFAYVIDDGTGRTATASVIVTVVPVNDQPTTTDDTATTAEDTATSIDVLANDTDPDTGDTLSIDSYDGTGVTHGILTDDGGDQFTYTPDADWSGTETFTYTVRDESGTTATATATITVTPVNDPPVAFDDAYVMQANTTLTVPGPGVLANDGDPDDDTITVTSHTQPIDLLGDVTVSPDGSVTYTSPVLGVAITRSFTYTVSDGAGGSDTATVTIDIQPAPVTTSTFYLGTSGSDANTYALTTTPPPPGNPEPDHDGDGKDGLTIKNSNRALDDPDPSRYQHWTHTFAADTAYEGQVRLGLWSTVEDFDDKGDGHYQVHLQDCAADGTDCDLLLDSDHHIGKWNNDVESWVFKDLSLGSIDHTFAAGRMLRVRLMFDHNPMWVAMSGGRDTRLILPEP
jgi:putative nucleotidyltransferase with HDIG domain